ncbi:MAG: Chrysochromulina ericina virus [Pseudomonadota bacterium]
MGTAYEDYEEYEELYHHVNAPRISSVLKPIHINGGVSDLCKPSGRVIVYRKEEWFKVFIHETMHNYGLDFSEMDISAANGLLHKMFTIQKDVKIYESYCEVWARIMNIVFETYFDINSRAKFSSRTTRKNFIDNITAKTITGESESNEGGGGREGSNTEISLVGIKNAQNRRKFLKQFYIMT